MGLSGQKVSVPTVLLTLGTWARMSQALWGGGARRDCLVFKPHQAVPKLPAQRNTEAPHFIHLHFAGL